MEDKVKAFTDKADSVRKVFEDFKKEFPDAKPIFSEENGLVFSMDIDKL